jgi:uncharacterized OsmC-like protein
MQANAKWVNGFQSVVNNGRNHSVVMDLPTDMNGEDMGATALEVAVMGLAGCVSTIFSMVCKNSDVSFSGLDVSLDADKPKGASTVQSVTGKVKVTSKEETEKLQKMLDKTMNACPVGVLFEKAGVEMNLELVHATD